MKNLQERIAIMIAFQTVVTHGKKTLSETATQEIVELARHLNEFCGLNLSKAFPSGEMDFVEDRGAAKIDAAIELHKQELKTKEVTQLPEDRETLIQLYDRLQQRKSRRMQWELYAKAKETKLADLVLKLLDEEIEDANAGWPQ
jgi:hypothetical protein